MRYGSLFSGIGGLDLGFDRAGMDCAWQVEIDAKCRNVLAKHWPNTKRYTDVRQVGRDNLEPVDVITGGFPCQDVSVSGRRAGLAGERSGLWFEFARVIDELEPRWAVIENVPGLLSSSRGADFAVIIRWLAERGYGVAWRVLDAQYFGLAQRRRRVFIVASLGNGCAAQVLFEREGGNWHTAPSREEGQEVAYSITHGPSSGYRYSPEDNMIPDIALPLANSRTTDHQDESQQTYIAFNNRQDPITSEVAQPLGAKDNGNGISFTLRPRSGNVPFVGIRRLTPTECERLQGFPDGWTTGQADSTRYRQLGNAVAVPCAEWIGKYMMETNNKKGELK